MTHFYDIGEVAEQGRAAAYEATKHLRQIKATGTTTGRLDAAERELRIALARVGHLRERHNERYESSPTVAVDDFVREFGPGIS